MFDFSRSKNKREVKIVCEYFYFMNPSKINIMFNKINKRKINQQKKIFELRSGLSDFSAQTIFFLSPNPPKSKITYSGGAIGVARQLNLGGQNLNLFSSLRSEFYFTLLRIVINGKYIIT